LKNVFKTLSILLSYPNEAHRALYKHRDELLSIIESEDREIAGLISGFMDRVSLFELDEKFVSLFEMPPKCPLYAHEHMKLHKESEVGNYLLEVKIFYKAKGLDIDAGKELPDYLPVMLEYLANLLPNDQGLARVFVRKYMRPWVGKWAECVKREDEDFGLLAEALEKALDRIDPRGAGSS